MVKDQSKAAVTGSPALTASYAGDNNFKGMTP